MILNTLKLSNPYFRFIFVFTFLILLWFSFYHFIYKIDFLLSSDNSFELLNFISKVLAKQSNFILNIFGYETLLEDHKDMIVTKIIGNDFEHGVWIGEPCNGVKLFGLFSIFIIAFPGKLKSKIWFIPIGILIIHFTNVIRIAILTVISSNNPKLLDFNHNVTFQVIIYSIILLLWFVWINKYADFNNIKKHKSIIV